jgi:hypothetical protein
MFQLTNQAREGSLLEDNNKNDSGWKRFLALGVRIWAQFFLLVGLILALINAAALNKERERKAPEIAIVREAILASTIQIELYGKGRVENGIKQVFVDEGLGTLIEHGGQRFIMTHNHWTLSAEQVDRVELRDATGAFLLKLNGSTFVSLVAYRDAGTLLFKAPPQLAGMKAARLGDTSELAINDTLWLAARDKEQHSVIRVIKAEVTQAGAVDMPGSLRLRERQRP